MSHLKINQRYFLPYQSPSEYRSYVKMEEGAATLDEFVASLIESKLSAREVLDKGKETKFGRMVVYRAWTKAKAAETQRVIERKDRLFKYAAKLILEEGNELNRALELCAAQGFEHDESRPVLESQIVLLPMHDASQGRGSLHGKRFSGVPALYFCINADEVKLAAALLASKHLSKRELEIDWQSSTGISLLHCVAGNVDCDLEILQSIIAKDADVSLTSGDVETPFELIPGGRTALHSAVIAGNLKAAQLLIEAKANPCKKDLCGNCPATARLVNFQSTNATPSDALVKLLIQSKADVTIPSVMLSEESWLEAAKAKFKKDQAETRKRIDEVIANEVARRVSAIKDVGPRRAKEIKLSERLRKISVVIVPGAGGDVHVMRANWYFWLGKELVSRGIDVIMPWRGMPEPRKCRERIWMAFLRDEMLAGRKTLEDCIFVGHSTGGDLILRLAEKEKVAGMLVCSAGQLAEELKEDMTEEEEKDCGYYDRPWNWDKVKANASWILHFHSEDDKVVPIDEGRSIHSNAQTEFTQLKSHGHCVANSFPEILQALLKKISISD